jgi:hypothetical protein
MARRSKNPKSVTTTNAHKRLRIALRNAIGTTSWNHRGTQYRSAVSGLLWVAVLVRGRWY